MFGNTTRGILGNINTLSNSIVRGNASPSSLTPLPSTLSYDEAKRQLEQFHAEVILGNRSFESYFSDMNSNKKILKDYVTATDQQSQSVQGLMRASQQARDAQKLQNEAMIQGTAIAKASQVAMKGLALAGNILVPMLVGSAISHVIEWMDDIKHRSEKLIAQGNEARQVISDISADLNAHKDVVSEGNDSYTKLASGVDSATNKNVSLSTEEYEQYLDLCNKISDSFPELIKGYDAEGNAMLNLGDNAEETAKKLEELYKQKQLMANLDIAEELPAAFQGYQEEVKDLDEQVGALEKDIARYRTLSLVGSDAGIQFSENLFSIAADHPASNDVLGEVYNAMGDLGFDTSMISFETKETETGETNSLLQGFSLTEDQILAVKNKLSKNTRELFYSYSVNLDQAEKKLQAINAKKKSKWQALVPSLISSISTYEDYSELSEEFQAAIRQIIANLDISKIDLSDYNGSIIDFLYMTFLQPFADPQTKETVTRLFSDFLKIDTSQVTEENKASIDKIIPELSKYLGIDEKQLKISLGLEDFDDLYQNKGILDAHARGKATKYVGGHGILDLKQYEPFSEVLDTVNTQDDIALLSQCVDETENLVAAVQKYNKLKQEAAYVDFYDEQFSDVRENLLSLARAGELTAQSFEDIEGADTFLTEIGMSAEEANTKIHSMLSTQEKLAAASSALDQLMNAYREFQELGFVTAKSLQALPDVFQNLNGFDLFSQIAGDPSQGAERIQEAFNDIVSQYLVSQDTLSGIANASESEMQTYIANLKQMNIQNAEEVVRNWQTLPDQKQLLAEAEAEYLNYLTTKDGYHTAYLYSTASKNGQLIAALGAPYQTDYKNWLNLLEKKSEAYNNFVNALNASQSSAFTGSREELEAWARQVVQDNGIEHDEKGNKLNKPRFSASVVAAAQQYLDSLAQEEEERKKLEEWLSTIPTDFGSGYSSNTSGSGSDSSGEEAKKQETPQTYDWIENKLSSITKLTEQMGKAFEKAFSIGSSKAKFQEYLAQIDAEISANNTAISTYQEKLDQINLEDAWVQKIKNGDFLIEDVTDEDLKKKISEYENYYNKQKQCEEELQALAEKKEQAQKSYADKMISYYDKQTSKIERLITLRKNLVSIKETFGGSASAKDVRYQQNKTLKEIASLERQIQNLKNLQKSTEKGTDAWQAYQEQIKKNKEKTEDLISSIAELASELAKLPLEKLDRYLEKNNAKNELYQAKLDNTTSAKKQNTLVNKQIKVTEQNNKKTQQTAKQTQKQLNTSKTAIKSAKTKDFKGLSKSDKTQLNKTYKKLQTYVKKKKQIPAELIKKFADAGLENLVKAISNYNAAIAANETAKETAKLTKETSKKEIAQLNLQKFQNIQNSYSLKQDALSRRSSKFSSALDLSEARGHLADTTYYIRLKKLEAKNIENLKAERKSLQSRLNSMLASGDIKKNSAEWQKMVEDIQSVDEALAQSEINFQEYQNQINQVKFDRFDYKLEQISRLISESEFYLDLMSNKPLTNDTGLNKRGITSMGLHYENFKVYKKQAAMYQKQIKKINEDLAKDPANTTLITQLQKYQDMQRECLQNSQAEKQAIADLVKEGYEALIDSLGKSISKYKEFLQNAKNAHDYQRNIAKQTENISTLRKQISAYSSMTDDPETAAKLQRLKEELENAEDSLNETMYDKYLSDTQNVMDDMLENLEDFISKLSKDREKLFKTGVDMIKGSTDTISATLDKISEKFGITLSTAMTQSWNSEKLISDGIQTIIDTFNNLLKEAKTKNDQQAYETASRSYSNSYQKLEKAEKEKKTAEKKRDKAKKNLGKAIENLDTQEQEHGKNSKQYKKAFKKLQTAQKKFESADKEYQQSQKKVSDLKAEKKAAKDADKTVIKDYLFSIADKKPSKKIEDMDILDKAVYEITKGYLNEQNRENLLKLLHTNNKETATDILWDLELYKGVPTLEKSHPTTAVDKYDTTKNHAVDENGRPIWNYAVEENVKPPKNASEILYIPKYDTASYSKVTADSEPFGAGISDGPAGYFPQAESLLKGFTSTYNAVPTSEPEYVSVSIGDLYLPNVTNPEDFSDGLVDALKNNPTVQKTFSTFVNASLTGGNSLGIRKF